MDFLFDIGNVIIGVDFIPALKRLIPSDTSDPETRLHQLLERKDEFEAGRIKPDVYFPWAMQTLGYTGPAERFMDAWVDIFSPNKAMWESIEMLHQKGHRLLLFSNINNPHKQYLLDQYPIFNCFSGGIFSYQTGHIKPEKEIYELAVKQYQLEPEKTAYIDDLPENIKGGKKMGFRCHQYRVDKHGAFLKWLDHIL